MLAAALLPRGAECVAGVICWPPSNGIGLTAYTACAERRQQAASVYYRQYAARTTKGGGIAGRGCTNYARFGAAMTDLVQDALQTDMASPPPFDLGEIEDTP